MPHLKCFVFSLRANVLYYFVYSAPRGDVCVHVRPCVSVCVGLALFLCNLVSRCRDAKIRLQGLKRAP